MYSLSIIAPAAETAAANSAIAALGYGPNTLSVPLVGDRAPEADEAPTHFGGHWWADAATVDALDALRLTALASCQMLARGPARAESNIAVEEVVGISEPTGTFNASIGDCVLIRHKQFNANQWGWRAEFRVRSPEFDPGVRAVAIYSDAAHQNYLYTTGAFTLQDGAWISEWNEGKPNKADVHFALLWASVVEAAGTLGVDDDVSALYLKYGLPASAVIPGGEEWVDTGVTVTQLVGAGIYRVSGIPTIAFDQQIRLGDFETGETVFAGYWPTTGTPSDYIKIAPHVSAAVGSKLWVWE